MSATEVLAPKISAVSHFLWKSSKRSTKHEKLNFPGSMLSVLICQHLVLEAISVFDAPLVAKHNTMAKAEFGGFISANTYIKHFNTVDF